MGEINPTVPHCIRRWSDSAIWGCCTVSRAISSPRSHEPFARSLDGCERKHPDVLGPSCSTATVRSGLQSKHNRNITQTCKLTDIKQVFINNWWDRKANVNPIFFLSYLLLSQTSLWLHGYSNDKNIHNLIHIHVIRTVAYWLKQQFPTFFLLHPKLKFYTKMLIVWVPRQKSLSKSFICNLVTFS